ncbi:hypothetical protein [Magnetovibrio blakemorei]|uniref:Uncharacterized protein n=1 Tax=Magnetovibrio blakemorei TaxID=28181 RepID=A0A1E5Q783_9PROT|nr:hypothetical protein [Magnetovibrio blakemorei]OEJ66857.1 hypothetical protein BEN30_10675 [Magnetovibrio blakemorei]
MSLPDDFPLNLAIDRQSLCDGRGRFREIIAELNAHHGPSLPDARSTESIFTDLGPPPLGSGAKVDVSRALDGINVIAVPGFLTECVAFLADCLTDALAHMEDLGARTSIAPVAGRGGCAFNAGRLYEHIKAQGTKPGELTILVPMSKGAADTLEMLALYPDVVAHIDAIVSIVGCVCGSPLQQMSPKWLKWIERNMPLFNCARFNGDAVHSLSPKTRTDFLSHFEMPKGVRVYSLGAAVGEEGVSKGMLPSYRALTTISPLNDGQMLLRDQIMPNATVLGVLNCDHIASAMPFNRNLGLLARFVTRQFLNRNAFPREIMLEAIVRQVIEDTQSLPTKS